MRTTTSIIALLAAATTPITTTLAAVLPWESCCFHLTAVGPSSSSSSSSSSNAGAGPNGVLTQLSGGQNRIGGGIHPVSYCIKNGILTDDHPNHRVCIFSQEQEPTGARTQFLCDGDPSHFTSFRITKRHLLEHEGSTTFYACPAGIGEWNMYTTPLVGQAKCVPITLSTNGKCATV